MAEGKEEQPVLLTQSDEIENEIKTSSENQVGEDFQEQQKLDDSNDSANEEAAQAPGEKTEPAAETSRAASAPEQSREDIDGSVKNVENSVLGIISASQSTIKSDKNDVGGDGDKDDFVELEKLSEKLEQVPLESGDGEEEYIAPQEDPYMRAVNYMERHKVMQIFQKLTAEIVYHRPPDPLVHMLGELQKMKKERDANFDAIISSPATSKGN